MSYVMAHVTLVLTRTPTQEFRYGKRSGRWGVMAVVEGPKVMAARFVPGSMMLPALAAAAALPSPLTPLLALGATAAQAASALLDGPAHAPTLAFAGRKLRLTTDSSPIKRVTEFDSMERFRADSGNGFYMQTKPRPDKPYKLTMFKSSTVAELNKTGECLRVHGHGYLQQGTNTPAGILVHEAPHVGWLIGCIAPREKNHRTQGHDRGPSTRAMQFIFNAMGGFQQGKEASLIVLDW
jgi:hypothetical protein